MKRSRMNINYVPVLILVLTAFGLEALQSQSLVDFEHLGDIDQDSLTRLFSVPAKQEVALYRITYETPGSDGLLDTASGLAVIPMELSKGIILYQHGTSSGPEQVPSTLQIADALIAIAYGGQGYIASAPDYLGLGTSRGFHPYVHAETEAQAGLDMLLATRQLMSELEVTEPPHIFVSGYSQGGHAAMALAQKIQERPTDDLWLTASAPMSGPYDISGVMRELILSDQEYEFVGYLVYIILGYQEVYGDMYSSLPEIVKPEYLSVIQQVERREISLTEMNEIVIPMLVANEGGVIPRKMFVDEYIDMYRDTTSTVYQRLLENDTYKWVPESPMELLYCSSDETVSFQNSIIAEEYMTSNGATDVVAINLSDQLNHGECALVTTLRSVGFFDSFSEPTPISEERILARGNIIYPNPSEGEFSIANKHAYERMTIYNSTGHVFLEQEIAEVNQLDFSHFMPGIYWVRLDGKSQSAVQKLILR